MIENAYIDGRCLIRQTNILMIMHATSWSDKWMEAKEGINQLIENMMFDRVIEFIQERSDIYQKRYSIHNGEIHTHKEISPVPYLNQNLFNILDEINLVSNDTITICGGVYNESEGCLNVLLHKLNDYLQQRKLKISIIIPKFAIYPQHNM